jgi:hypothetical protein
MIVGSSSLATSSQIRRFLDVVFRVEVADLGGKENVLMGKVNPKSILLNMLHSAWFWEFGRIRSTSFSLSFRMF